MYRDDTPEWTCLGRILAADHADVILAGDRASAGLASRNLGGERLKIKHISISQALSVNTGVPLRNRFWRLPGPTHACQGHSE